MKKIDKSSVYSSSCETWHTTLNDSSHDPYSASHPQYNNTLISLLICQDGLCAYTEIKILEKHEIDDLKKNFDENGNYTGNRIERPVDIEHFDSSLKPKSGWKWSNLFAADRFINQTIKRREEPIYGVDEILKPDTNEYNPFKLLEYDKSNNMFIPKSDGTLTPEEETRIENMIIVLGINCGYTKMRRKDYLFPLLETEHFKDITIKPEQFVTAYAMTKAEV